jgi:hypothetical protein
MLMLMLVLIAVTTKQITTIALATIIVITPQHPFS